MRFSLTALAAVAALALTGRPAQAGYEFRFADSTGAEKTSFDLDFAADPTLDVRVYLVATGTDTLAGGLKSYGVQLNYAGDAAAKVTSTADIASSAAFTGFAFRSVENDGGATDFARVRDSINPGAVTPASGDGDRILLATFTFTGLSNGSSIVFSADPAGANDTLLADGTAIDSLISGQSATITVTNVPEPGTMVLAGLLAAGIGGAGLRRLRRPVA